MASLLGQFYTRIRGKHEDFASEGLVYILQQSDRAKRALNNIIEHDSGLVFDNINYSTQNVGKNKERPDISGKDKNGKEVIIMEAKFWAELTNNQPIEYLNRMGDNSVLIFICPDLRTRPIFNELRIRIEKDEIYGNQFRQDTNSRSFSFDGNKKLIIKTWKEILDTIKHNLMQGNELSLLSDIDQIIGLCEIIDSTSFQPYQDEDFAPSIARKINSYYNLADKVVDELKKNNLVDTAGLNAQGQRYGYTRYFKAELIALALEVRFDYWEKDVNTPFWLCLREIQTTDGKWTQTERFKNEIRNVVAKNSFTLYEDKGILFVPIIPLLEKTEDVVIKDIADKIETIINDLKAT